MTFFGQLTGKHYGSEQARDHYEHLEEVRRRKPTEEEEEISKLNTAELGEWIKQSYRTEENKIHAKTRQTVGDLFVERHPEYIDCPQNAEQMLNFFRSRRLDVPSPMDFNDAYNHLRGAGLLKLDEEKIRIDKERERFDLADASEDDLRTMPLDELRRRVAMEQRASASVMPDASEDELRAMPLDELRRRAGSSL